MTGYKRKKLPEPDEHGKYTEKQLKRLHQYAWNSSIWYLQKMDHTAHAMKLKLQRKGVPDFVIEATINKLIEERHLNDVQYAENFVYSKRTYEKLGLNSIRNKLSQKGISQEIIEEVLRDIEDEDLEHTARLLAEKRVATPGYRKETDVQKKTQKLVQFLAYRGYNGGLAYQIATEVIAEYEENKEEEDF